MRQRVCALLQWPRGGSPNSRRRRRRDSRLTVAAEAQTGGLAIADRGNMFGPRSQPEQRHVAVDTLVLPCVHHEGLVPDTNAAVSANPPIEVLPCLQMRIGRVTGKILQVLETPPILHTHHLAPPH